MLFPLFIRESISAVVAIELFFVKLLLYKSIDVLAKVDIVTAVWTLTTSILPLCYAWSAGQLITLQALFGILDNLKAYETTEVVIEGLYSVIGLQVLISVDQLFL